MNFCIPKDLIDKLKPRMKEVGGAKLIKMSQKELTDFFSETVGEKLGIEVAKSFHKASLSHQKDAMKKWANKVLTVGEAKEVKKIADSWTEDDGVYETIDGDVIERALGVTITAEEVDKINEIAKKMHEAYTTDINEFTQIGNNYPNVVKEMNDYLDTINQMSTSELIFGQIGRGNMLFSLSSGMLNIVSNTFMAGTHKSVDSVMEIATSFIEKREFRLKGVNPDLILDYFKYAVKTHYSTGIDIVRVMEATDKTTVLGEHYKGIGNEKGILRDIGRFNQKWVFQVVQGLGDIGFASLQFAHKIDIESTKIADRKGLTGEAHKAEARRLFLMATSLILDKNNPEHQEALNIKREALRYSMVATAQNNTDLARELMEIRRKIDDYSGDIRVGTNFVAPFLKTVANIVVYSADMTGITSPLAVQKIVKGLRVGDKEAIRDGSEVIIRMGLGLLFAQLLAMMIPDDDYMPDYITSSPAQKELNKTQGVPYNSIRIGDKWVSIQWFGTMGWATAGILSARGSKDPFLEYGKNFILQGLQTPVISYGYDTITYLSDMNRYNKDAEDVKGDIVAGASGFFMSRFIPAIVPQIAKGIDENERYIDNKQAPLNVAYETLQSKIPYWRNFLSPKYNDFGDVMKTESLVSNILAGSRLKTAKPRDEVFAELLSLSKSGEDVTLKFDSFKDMKKLRTITSPKEYNEFRGALQKKMYNTYSNIMGEKEYKEMPVDERKKMLIDERRDILNDTLDDFGYSSRLDSLE